MRPFNLGILYGMITFGALVAGVFIGHKVADEAIIRSCTEHRAFTVEDGAWGCVRLKKGVRDMGRDELLRNEKVKV